MTFQHGSQALSIAADCGNIAATTLFLERGSDVNAKNKVRVEVTVVDIFRDIDLLYFLLCMVLAAHVLTSQRCTSLYSGW
jgi:ankyrin repeat protein